jgi:hypothetical protein
MAVTRKCGTCTLCCTLLPVNSIGKKANQRCPAVRFGKGCTVYRTMQMPPACRLWSCAWILNAPLLKRPDHGHYVVDMMPDFVIVGNDPDKPGSGEKVAAIQVWLDPRYPDAHRDQGLRDYLRQRGRDEAAVAIIRLSAKDGFVLVPPELSSTGQWLEIQSAMTENTHSAAEIAEFMMGKDNGSDPSLA